MWKLYQKATAFSLHPADELNIPPDEKWLRWMFGNAVHAFGTWMENKLAERDRDGRPVHRIEKLLNLPIQKKSVSIAQFEAMGLVRS